MCWPSSAKAQSNPPFQNPSLDTNCYFPQIGVPGEIDTIYGAVNNQELGGYIIKNLGSKPNGGYANLFIGNLDAKDHSIGSPTLTEISTGSSFNLHNLNRISQKISADNIFPRNGSGASFRLGHFHDHSHIDIFVIDLWRIYWADDFGNYDSTRFTNLSVNVRGNIAAGYEYNAITAYITNLTSDTVDDLLLGAYTVWNDKSQDSMFVALFRGGANLMSKSLAFEDTSAMAYPILQFSNGQNYLVSTQGDFRGVGRDDLIVADVSGNLWYYKNDPPFRIGDLAKSIANDTLLVGWQNPHWVQHTTVNSTETPFFSMRAMPKKPGDSSIDFMPVLATNDYRDSGIFIFRGGPTFGSHRLFLDSADFVITKPDLGYDLWPAGPLNDAGDMTGTGIHVLDVGAGQGQNGYDNFYLTGAALDNKIDIYNYAYGGFDDTLTADNDSLEDFIECGPYYTSPDDLSKGKSSLGTIWVYHGSKNIPVHLNPHWEAVKNIPTQDGVAITFAPNPVIKSWSVATIIWPEAEPEAQYAIYDMLGREVDRGTIRLLGGPEQQRIYFSNLPQGTYIYVLTGSKHTASTKIVKLSAASTGGSSQPNIIQQMKAARDAPR